MIRGTTIALFKYGAAGTMIDVPVSRKDNDVKVSMTALMEAIHIPKSEFHRYLTTVENKAIKIFVAVETENLGISFSEHEMLDVESMCRFLLWFFLQTPPSFAKQAVFEFLMDLAYAGGQLVFGNADNDER